MHRINEGDWARINKLGLLPNIKTPYDYLDVTALGAKRTAEAFKNHSSTIPQSDLIQSLHKSMFGDVHPWAGQFRVQGQEVQAGDLLCTLAKDIPKELKALNKEMLTNSLEGSIDYKATLVAYYHAVFEQIHPFLDGNGRIGRIIMSGQTQKLMGRELNFEKFTRLEYIESLQTAQMKGEIEPLADLIIRNSISLKKPTLEELQLKEKLLHKEKKILGFIGSELDGVYGLGGFPKPISNEHALRLAKEDKHSDLPVEQKVKLILEYDKQLNLRRKNVLQDLSSVRIEMTKLSKPDSKKLGKTLGR